jgi:hypothetical protein
MSASRLKEHMFLLAALDDYSWQLPLAERRI